MTGDQLSVGAMTLGEASSEAARSDEFRFRDLTDDEQRIYVAVERFRHQFRGDGRKAMSARHACEALHVDLETYLEARRKAVATDAEAFGAPHERDLIRPSTEGRR